MTWFALCFVLGILAVSIELLFAYAERQHSGQRKD